MDPYLVYLIARALWIWTVVATIAVLFMIWLLMKDNDDRVEEDRDSGSNKKTYPQVVREWLEFEELGFEDSLLITRQGS